MMRSRRRPSFTTVMLVLGLLFLYLPMVVLVVYSFNESRLVTVWAGFSTQWYGELFRDQQILSAVWTSLEIAFFAASMAVCLGTVAAFVMTRYGHFRGKTALSSMVTAPLVMPEVITGLSLLLLFVQMAQLIGWPADRGMATIWIAHTTFCSAYVAVVVGRLVIDLPVRTLYSGVYARRRIYRPVAAVFGSELSGLLAVLALWGWLGPWSFPLALAAAIAVSRAILVVYTLRAYDGMGLPRPGVRWRAALQLRSRDDGPMLVAAGLANASTRVGSMLVLALGWLFEF